ncbi:c-type cytochrome biogenesis protein CcmI [Stenotrophobium rhamnosiphilum]|uniref:C-type cytochrome biogenesis protein CcmI n=1 Tax=Stenotrophobium rhamnosiphilum TaxID=2029166 RepID=A0A2T5MHD2_9GAMM|nr:c-type cytochrome biogenesis protein CcmI [Stenotrophobium rhamnosiphilum]PTU31967.1 c-type cytochrome biogenesis protein CcmI [Stenotrophobium rhamnosiphilum]
MISYVAMAVLALLSLVWLLRPWWRRGEAPQQERKQANLVAYRTRLAEIENDLSSGLVDAGAAAALKQELAARLLSDVDAVPTGPQIAQRRPYLAVLMALSLSVFAAIWYFNGDSWETQQTIDQALAHPDQAQQLTVQAMVQRLEKRLKKTPEDAEGWALLGRSYFITQRYVEASQAYAKANLLNGNQTADWLVGQGESLAMSHERQVAGEPAKLFEQALVLEPNQGKALWYAGLAAAQAGNYKASLTHWLKLRDQELPEELRTALDARLQELAQLGNLKIPERAVAKADAASVVSLKIKVSVAPALASKVPAGASLLVFAKAAGGPPMPLAVQKLEASQLPLTVTLDDSMAMMPTMKLSQFPRWILTARISPSGTAQAQAGDLQGQIELGRDEASKPVTLLISEVVQ